MHSAWCVHILMFCWSLLRLGKTHQKRSSEGPEVCTVPDYLRIADPRLSQFILNNELRKYEHISDRPTCPKKMQSHSSLDANDRSSCPWYYVINHDEKRVPPTLLHARCECNWCLNDPQNYSTNCEPVYYTFRVLRRSEECNTENQFTYNYFWETVPIACACTKPGRADIR